MTILEIMKGRTVRMTTDVGIVANLVIESVEEQRHSVEIGPSTPENDYWPPTRDWTTYKVNFVGGFSKVYQRIENIDLE